MGIAYFDCFSGIAGDMVLGALADAGADEAGLADLPRRLGLDGASIRFQRVRRGALTGTRAEVTFRDEGAERHLPEILRIIQAAALPGRVKARAGAVFQRLAEAEAAVHGMPVERVHFHEVGGVDAILDIVGAAWALESLGVDRVYASEVPLGRGTVTCRHGVLPLPAPAVSRLLEGFPVRLTEVPRELTTPTGAAILAALAERGGGAPSFVMERTGMGFGGGEEEGPGGVPNGLRVWVGAGDPGDARAVVLLETVLDDVTGETAGFLLERCLEAGALDAYFLPVHMKKSRPGLLFCALCPVERAPALTRFIHQESGTLGVRIRPVLRSVLPRTTETRRTSLGPVSVKRARLPDGTVSLSPEYEDVARIARERNLPLRAVLDVVLREVGEA